MFLDMKTPKLSINSEQVDITKRIAKHKIRLLLDSLDNTVLSYQIRIIIAAMILR